MLSRWTPHLLFPATLLTLSTRWMMASRSSYRRMITYLYHTYINSVSVKGWPQDSVPITCDFHLPAWTWKEKRNFVTRVKAEYDQSPVSKRGPCLFYGCGPLAGCLVNKGSMRHTGTTLRPLDKGTGSMSREMSVLRGVPICWHYCHDDVGEPTACRKYLVGDISFGHLTVGNLIVGR